MRHLNVSRRFGRDTAHRKALFNNLSISLIRYGKIETSLTKAKELRKHIDHLITLGKENTLHARRLAFKTLKDRTLISKLFGEIAPSFANRHGGYTRIIRTRNRVGDCAPMGVIELIRDTKPAGEAEKAAAPEKKD